MSTKKKGIAAKCAPEESNLMDIEKSELTAVELYTNIEWLHKIDSIKHSCIQIQCAGFSKDEFLPIMRQPSHIHLTGYIYGSDLWHTQIHHSLEQSFYILDLLKNAGYSEMVVSDAMISLQTLSEFETIN